MKSEKLSNKIIKLGDYIYRVYPFTSIDKLELGNAYTFGAKPHPKFGTLYQSHVLPFRGNFSDESDEVGIYINTKTGKKVIIYPSTPAEKSMYAIERVLGITPANINTQLTEYLKDIDPNELKYSGNIFMPQIHSNDDIGVKAIKMAISAKQIDFNAYKNRFDKPYEVSNTRKALTTSPTLTFSMLMKYCSLFDLEFGVIFFDSKDSKDPMFKKDNPYSAIAMFNSEQFPIDDTRIKIVNGMEDVLGFLPEYNEQVDGGDDE